MTPKATIPPSAVAKFSRAQEHFTHLQQLVTAFFAPKPYRIRTESNDDLTEHRFYVEFDTPVPETEWGLIFGDGVHCLRSALDHTVYAVAVKESGTDPPPAWRELMFPITEDVSKWKGQERRIKTLGGPVRAVLKTLQPHGSQDEFFLRPLGGLQEFDNADKHRAVRAVATIPVHSLDNISGLVPGAQYSPDYRIAPLKDGTPWMTLTCAVPTPDVKVRSNLTLDVGIPWVRGNGVETTVLIWPSVDTMNKAVTDALTALAPF